MTFYDRKENKFEQGGDQHDKNFPEDFLWYMFSGLVDGCIALQHTKPLPVTHLDLSNSGNVLFKPDEDKSNPVSRCPSLIVLSSKLIASTVASPCHYRLWDVLLCSQSCPFY
jgi:hypothetical protein